MSMLARSPLSRLRFLIGEGTSGGAITLFLRLRWVPCASSGVFLRVLGI